MLELHLSSAIVTIENKPKGILTFKDILMRVIAQNLLPDSTLAEKIRLLLMLCIQCMMGNSCICQLWIEMEMSLLLWMSSTSPMQLLPLYSTDYGMFHFCIADTEHDWRAGSEQYKLLEKCLASANRHKQPLLIFAGHRPPEYSFSKWFGEEGSFEEPMIGRKLSFGAWDSRKSNVLITFKEMFIWIY